MRIGFRKTENILYNADLNILASQFWFVLYDSANELKHKDKRITEKVKNKESFGYNAITKEFIPCPDFTSIIQKAENSKIKFEKVYGLIYKDQYIYKGTIDGVLVYTALDKDFVDMLCFPEVLYGTDTTSMLVWKIKSKDGSSFVSGAIMPVRFDINDLKKDIL